MAHRILFPIFLFAVLHARAQQPHQHMHTPDTMNMQEHPMMHGEGDMMMRRYARLPLPDDESGRLHFHRPRTGRNEIRF